MAQQYSCEFTTKADGRNLRRAAERKRRKAAKKQAMEGGGNMTEPTAREWVDPNPPDRQDYEFREEFEERYKEWAARATVSGILANTFGSDFSGATQDQRLLLLEAVALSLRTGGWQHKLRLVCSRTRTSRRPPENCFSPLELGRNEGLKLLAILNVAIVEGYSVEAANERLHT